MAQVFPPGPASKAPTSCSSPHLHLFCVLSPLLSPFPKPSRDQLRQPGAQTSITPHPAPHPLYTKWKEVPSLCLARSSQQQRQAQQSPRGRQPGWRGGGVRDALCLCGEGAPPAGPCGEAGSQHRRPFGLLDVTGCPSSKSHPHPSVPRQPASAIVVSLCSQKGCGKWGFKNHYTVCGMVASPALAFHVAAPPQVTKHSLVLWCWPRSQALDSMPQTASISHRLTGPGSPHHMLCWACSNLEQLLLHVCDLILSSLTKRKEDLKLLIALENEDIFLILFLLF